MSIYADPTDRPRHSGIDRRAFLVGAVGLAGTAASWTVPGWLGRAAAAAACPGRLSDIDHVVILIQENRSFDHYFGTYPRR
jgi:phospholipase C